MRYLGGKGRLAKKFAPILLEALTPTSRFVEPFVGGFNVVPALGHVRALCNDVHPGLFSLYCALQGGSIPPEELSEERYAEMRRAQDWDDPLTAFAAFGCSFAGKEWGGYARDAQGTNYARTARNSLLRKAKFMSGVVFTCVDYRDLSTGPGDVVYADPPYANTTGYKTGHFDHSAFFEWCEQCVQSGARVFVSEFAVPDRSGWEVVWSTERKVMVDGKSQGDGRVRTDYLVEVQP